MDLPRFQVIRPDIAIFLFYAGRDRKYMALSRSERKVFLELPGFNASANTFDDEAEIIRHLNLSSAVARFLKDPRRPNPSRALRDYSHSVPSVAGRPDRSFLAELGNVKAMFVDAKPGDLIMMTPFNHYDPLLIGEIERKWRPEYTLPIEFLGNEQVPFLPVRWLSHGLGRRDFPREVARRLQNRKAITKIDPNYYDQIFRLVYRAYIWGNTSKLDIFAPGYSSGDPTATREASFIIKYSIAAYAAFTKGEMDAFNDLELEDAADRYFDPNIVEQLSQVFGSPGGYVAKLIGAAACLGVAGVVAMAMSDESQPIGNVQGNISDAIRDSGPTDDGILDVDGVTNSIRAGRGDELRQRYGRPARAKLGLTLEGSRPPEVSVRNREGVEETNEDE